MRPQVLSHFTSRSFVSKKTSGFQGITAYPASNTTLTTYSCIHGHYRSCYCQTGTLYFKVGFGQYSNFTPPAAINGTTLKKFLYSVCGRRQASARLVGSEVGWVGVEGRGVGWWWGGGGLKELNVNNAVVSHPVRSDQE